MKLAIRFLQTVLLAAILLPSLAAAQTTPEEAAKAYFQALKTEGFEVAPRYIHPKELERFKSMLMPLFLVEGADTNLSTLFFGAPKTAAEITAMDPAEFMEGFLSVVGAQVKEANVSLGDTEIIGTVKEGDITHVLTRSTAGNADVKLTQVEVISMIPDGDSWKLLLSGKMEGIAQALKAQLEKRRE